MRRISNVEVYRLVEELRNTIVGCRVGNIYQISKNLFSIMFRGREKIEVIIIPGFALFITNYVWKKPEKPTSFAMALRKFVRGLRVLNVYQHDFERIVVFHLGFEKI